MKYWIIRGSAVQEKVYSIMFHILISRRATEEHDLSNEKTTPASKNKMPSQVLCLLHWGWENMPLVRTHEASDTVKENGRSDRDEEDEEEWKQSVQSVVSVLSSESTRVGWVICLLNRCYCFRMKAEDEEVDKYLHVPCVMWGTHQS